MMIELLETYSKAAVKIKEWFLEKMLDNLKKTDDSIPEEFKDYVRQQGIDDDKVAKILGANPRTLFDVFDENQLYIKMDIFIREDGTAKFGWSINAEQGPSSFYNSRIEAEKDAVAKAFQMLNDKL
jgi:hypothetical protein